MGEIPHKNCSVFIHDVVDVACFLHLSRKILKRERNRHFYTCINLLTSNQMVFIVKFALTKRKVNGLNENVSES